MDWANVWRNLQAASIPETTKAIWYMVLQDILPTMKDYTTSDWQQLIETDIMMGKTRFNTALLNVVKGHWCGNRHGSD